MRCLAGLPRRTLTCRDIGNYNVTFVAEGEAASFSIDIDNSVPSLFDVEL